MSSTILVASIAGVVSLIGAYFSWKQAVRVKRIEILAQAHLASVNAQTQISLEAVKNENARVQKAFETAIAESGSIEQNLSMIWRQLQSLKEQIALLISSLQADRMPFSLENLYKDHVSNLKDEFGEYVHTYYVIGSMIPTLACDAAHSAKNVLARAIRDYESMATNGPVADEAIKFWAKTRNQLSGYQKIIGEERADVRLQLYHKYLDILAPPGTLVEEIQDR